MLLVSSFFHVLKFFSSGSRQKQGAEQDGLLISPSTAICLGCENLAVLNCTSRTRGEKEKVSKEEIEAQRIKRVNCRESLLKGLIGS